MDIKKRYNISTVIGFLFLFLTLLFFSDSNFIFFHSIAEFASIFIAFSIFLFAWPSRKYSENDTLLFLGIAYVFIGGLDILHTFSYKGMNIFPNVDSADTATQLWIAARFTEAFSLLILPLFFNKRVKVYKIFGVYFCCTALMVLSIFQYDIFPACFIEGEGLTLFKKMSEYFIIILLIAAVLNISRYKNRINSLLYRYFVASVVLTILSEAAFTTYIGVYGFSNFIGHYFKILSFYFIYKGAVENGLFNPYRVMFKDLKESKDRNLEQNIALKEEVARREKYEEDLKKLYDMLYNEKTEMHKNYESETKKRQELVNKISVLASSKADLAQKQYQLNQMIMDLRNENRVLTEQLSKYVQIVESAELGINRMIKGEESGISDISQTGD